MSNKERKKFALKIKEAIMLSEYSIELEEQVIEKYLLVLEQEIKSRILREINTAKVYTLENYKTSQLDMPAVVSRCSSCKNWSRYSIHDKPANIGSCSALENDINYWDGIDIAQKKVQDGKIGAENLYTHENFGCVHYNRP